MTGNGWPVEHDDFEYQPIPASWIAHDSAYDATEGVGPNTYAVSAAPYGSRTLRIRYLYPATEDIYLCQTAATDETHDAMDREGLVPQRLAEKRSWPRSRTITNPAVEANDVARQVELEHFETLWGERIGTERRELRADGGTERAECWRCGYMRPTYESCPECGGSCKPLTKQEQQQRGDADGE